MAGDASTRRFWRVLRPPSTTRPEEPATAVLMACDEGDRSEEIALFLATAAHFAEAGIHVPAVYAHEDRLGLVLQEDLGRRS
jgi:aminoglycoside/choline kinase family phosphotransferase